MNNQDIRVIFLYEIKLAKTAAEVAGNINLAFGEGYVNVRTLERSFAKFKTSDFSLENEPRGEDMITF
ncbi:Histone-lysine N-methyltransferase SETMAR [Habropoda laboriosa]|uniref:Histone-lysine N-methyltransferase SETMAR n=1 Tax=Habropoda laboriosa TaxID=597456 RepID=A0A0L7RFQ1_9HYME|nr:Histone-lysine N-methyltransferase SETMAR [Habropoda laboriosa]